MKISRKGSYRLVLLIGRVAIKIAWGHDHRSFLYGCYANVSERRICKHWKTVSPEYLDIVARSIYCSWFGLVQIQHRVNTMVRDLTKEEQEYFNEICNGDFKKENFGMIGLRVVCVDYP